MKTYSLYVKRGGQWERVGTIYAMTHPEALREAIAKVKPEHYDKPIRVEQEEGPGGSLEAMEG